MTDLASSVAPPRPTLSDRAKFYGLWIATATDRKSVV